MEILVYSEMQKKMVRCLMHLTMNVLILSVLAFAWIMPETASAQVHTFTKEQMETYTALNPYGRFPDGRPMIPDADRKSVV